MSILACMSFSLSFVLLVYHVAFLFLGLLACFWLIDMVPCIFPFFVAWVAISCMSGLCQCFVGSLLVLWYVGWLVFLSFYSGILWPISWILSYKLNESNYFDNAKIDTAKWDALPLYRYTQDLKIATLNMWKIYNMNTSYYCILIDQGACPSNWLSKHRTDYINVDNMLIRFSYQKQERVIHFSHIIFWM